MQNNARNLKYLRASNQVAILKEFLLEKHISKQDLANKLNLTAMSISYITADLIEKGILKDVEGIKRITNSPGRRASLLSLNGNKILAIGVSLTRRHIITSLVGLGGDVIKSFSHRHTDNTSADSLTEIILSDIELLLNEVKDNILLGVGVSSAGFVNVKDRNIISITDFYSIKNWKICDIVEKKYNIPCYLANDMHSSALAESYYGRAKTYSDFLYLGITYGLGSSVILNGKLLEGNFGFCGEVGHTTLYHDGKVCSCGNRGCAELYLSVNTLLKKSGTNDWQEFLNFCDENPQSSVVQEFVYDLTTFLVNLINTFDPEAVIIGHEGASLLLKDTIYNQLNKDINQRIISRLLKNISVLPSSIYNKIDELNAASIVFSHLFNGEFKL